MLRTESSVLEIPVSQKFKYLGFAAWQQQNLVQSWGVFCSQTKFHVSTGIFMREISPMVIIFSPCCCLGIATYFKELNVPGNLVQHIWSSVFVLLWRNFAGSFCKCMESSGCYQLGGQQLQPGDTSSLTLSLNSGLKLWLTWWHGASSREAQLAFLLSYFHQEAFRAVLGMLNVYLPDGIFSLSVTLLSIHWPFPSPTHLPPEASPGPHHCRGHKQSLHSSHCQLVWNGFPQLHQDGFRSNTSTVPLQRFPQFT